jgi:hypothetical protein
MLVFAMPFAVRNALFKKYWLKPLMLQEFGHAAYFAGGWLAWNGNGVGL